MVYNQAHKFHHYLHDTTAFDAHVYGAGAPEEWWSLMLELGWVAVVLSLLPRHRIDRPHSVTLTVRR